MNTIDFQELRRQERQRIRSSKNESVGGSNADGVEPSITLPSASTSSMSNADECTSNDHSSSSLATYETLLQQNKLSDHHRVGSHLDSVFYAQNFLSSISSKEIMAWLQQCIPEYDPNGPGERVGRTEREESIQHNGKWTRLKHARRKVALFDGTICNLPFILQRISNTLVAIGAFPPSHPPNHVLVNEYQPGEGIMPHTDGPAYDSCTATISLGGSDVIFKLWPRQQHDTELPTSSTNAQPSLEVILHGNGSLVLFTNDAYLYHLHEISEVLEERTSSSGICGNDVKGGTLVKRGYRISLTFRCKK